MRRMRRTLQMRLGWISSYTLAQGLSLAGSLWAKRRGRRNDVNRTEHLLDILIEECAEVIQRATKAKRFGMNEIQPGQELSNEARIAYELNDIVAVADMLMPCDWMNADANEAKIKKVEHFLEYSKECGMLDEGEPASRAATGAEGKGDES
jgi:hypothetical protein